MHPHTECVLVPAPQGNNVRRISQCGNLFSAPEGRRRLGFLFSAPEGRRCLGFLFRVSLNLFRVFGLCGHVVSFSESHGACSFLEVVGGRHCKHRPACCCGCCSLL